MQINTSHVDRNLQIASSALSHSSEYQELVRGRPQIRISCEASRRTKLSDCCTLQMCHTNTQADPFRGISFKELQMLKKRE